MEFVLQRDYFGAPANGAEGFTLGEWSLNGSRIGYTVEDEDRKLEDGGVKVYGKTCIPRGRYEIIVDYSKRFNKVLPRILNVPGFEGIRVHGGNKAEDSEGCPCIGRDRTTAGVQNCQGALSRLIELIALAEDREERCWVVVQ